jgi:hypothetical protein
MCHWWLTSLSTIYSYIVKFSFLGGWVNRSTRRNHHRLIASHWHIAVEPWASHVAYSFSKYINGMSKMHASQFYHDPRDNDENVCKIPVFNNLHPIHKLWYKQPRKKYLSVRSKNVLLFVVQDTAQNHNTYRQINTSKSYKNKLQKKNNWHNMDTTIYQVSERILK